MSTVEKHHHEVGAAQHELGMNFDSADASADQLQLYKYVVHNVAHAYGKTATFHAEAGVRRQRHRHALPPVDLQAARPVFAGNKYADLSETCLIYIGGILKHAKPLNAFTNPSTNSYKRLVPGYEAPVLLAYSARNRSASCRIPHVANPKGKRSRYASPIPWPTPISPSRRC